MIQIKKPSHTATLLNNGAVQGAIKALSAAIDDLESEVGNFQTDNWKEVVPQVDSAATSVREAFDALRKELGTPDS